MPNQNSHDEKPWRDKETLREEYVHKQRTTHELAEEWGCHHSTVADWVRRYGFDTYNQLPNFTLGSPKSEERPDGTRSSKATYETAQHLDESGSKRYIRHHRLLAVAEWGLDAIRDMEVHHQNNIPWDNRSDNLELLTKEEHAREHRGTEVVDGEPWYAEGNLRRLYDELEWSLNEIAEEYDVTISTVISHMKKSGIERRATWETRRLQQQDGQQQMLNTFTGDD